MSQKIWFVLALTFGLSSLSARGDATDSLCNFVPGEGGLLKAICQLPGCPNGSDCSAPMIQADGASIEYFEPILQWKEICPNTAVASSCWEIYIDYKLKLVAVDNGGIGGIGSVFLQSINGKKIEKRSWSKGIKKGADGRYEMNGAVTVHVPAGRSLELKVSELCAKDLMNNEGCYPVALPTALPALGLTSGGGQNRR